MDLSNEKVFHGARKIKYLLKENKDSDKLVVVFSGFGPKGIKPKYNYIRTLQTLNVNKLFILDEYGERGCYYLGENRVFDVESSVVSLITFIANQNYISHSNIICCGSSKGGYAALYFGIKYGFGHVIAGAPQTKLGNYLFYAKEHPTLSYIAGDNSVESVYYLDKLLYDIVLNTRKIPEITIHVGSGDHHYKGHVLPFVDHLKTINFNCEVDIKDYSDHGDVRHYQSLLIDKLIEKIPSLNDSLRILNVEVQRDLNSFQLITNVNKPTQYAWYVYKNEERIMTKWYSTENNFEFTATENGEYYFLAFVKDEHGNVMSERTNNFVVDEVKKIPL
ncbi:hypothetical protein M3598_01135 [Cytobacillus oceanisediminis]|uniref:hypothetical protein n=1 Tax=Cytobacillus oceanisediminis TaxID=665099 RepID=UPI00203BA1B7|nr:hypothetical protein [Cytobacillus oceanisediminis]MCM3241335.1 hypothetical protein [Cytobacillus oceanisediminis]